MPKEAVSVTFDTASFLFNPIYQVMNMFRNFGIYVNIKG